MVYITQEQALKAIELLQDFEYYFKNYKPKNWDEYIVRDWISDKDLLLAKIKLNKPQTNAAETVFGKMRDLNDEEAKKYREMLAKDTVIATAEQIEKAGKPQTNGDRWRAISDEQIAEIIATDGCAKCPAGKECNLSPAFNEPDCERLCRASIVRWLKTEAKGND